MANIDLSQIFAALQGKANTPIADPAAMQQAMAAPTSDQLNAQALRSAFAKAGAAISSSKGGLLSALGQGMSTGANDYVDQTNPVNQSKVILDAIMNAQKVKELQMGDQTKLLEAGTNVNQDSRAAVKSAFDMSAENKRIGFEGQRIGMEGDRNAVLNAATKQGIDINASQEGRAAEEAKYNKGRRGTVAEFAAQEAADKAINQRATSLGLNRVPNPDETDEQTRARQAAEEQLAQFTQQTYDRYGIRTHGTKDKPAQLTTKADFDALKPGEYFINPKDGKLMVKKG